MSPGTFTVVTADDTYTLPITDSLSVEEALGAAFPDGFNWEDHSVRLDNQGVNESQAQNQRVSPGQTITVLSSGLAQAGIKGN